ncbi:MAG: deoxyribose-phosphate aldolase [Bacilli bacterium]|nr:deoxyribose-phosphate aldolase [Bacilli bacterium]
MNINEYLDSTNLSKIATVEDIIKLCEDAKKYHFPCIIVPPYYVASAVEYLKDTTVFVGTVVGFPNGYQTKESKQFEAINAIDVGAKEIDMVININALKNKDYDYIKDEIELVRDSIGGKTLKVIIESCLLTDDEIVEMTKICNETFVHFIKTSTGFDKAGASIEVIDLINKHKNEVLEIKASGGIKTKEQVLEFIDHGVTRIGTSHATEIMEQE